MGCMNAARRRAKKAKPAQELEGGNKAIENTCLQSSVFLLFRRLSTPEGEENHFQIVDPKDFMDESDTAQISVARIENLGRGSVLDFEVPRHTHGNTLFLSREVYGYGLDWDEEGIRLPKPFGMGQEWCEAVAIYYYNNVVVCWKGWDREGTQRAWYYFQKTDFHT
ncbi:hypothetical protein BPOR_0525g00080 [Botrytis porri]|uniref:Uncharacterized protein n=1 Tax=Botrytis porri TaxID=87229 RepID=A0A4Z1KFX5_9HELO|nr:hypothetical protein BPOR_0525g00080 [Botrytis porri]